MVTEVTMYETADGVICKSRKEAEQAEAWAHANKLVEGILHRDMTSDELLNAITTDKAVSEAIVALITSSRAYISAMEVDRDE